MKVVALVPAYNEEVRVRQTVESIAQIPQIAEIVVIDDGSQDRTREAATLGGARVISLKENRGKGYALQAGVDTVDADVYLLLDADLEQSAIHAQELLPPVLAGDADMTIAHFVAKQAEGKMGMGIAKRIAQWGIYRLSGFQAQSPLSGQRALRKEVIQAVGGFAPGFGVEAALTISAVRRGFRVREIPLPMTHRATGRDLAGFLHRGRQLVMICRVLWQAWREG